MPCIVGIFRVILFAARTTVTLGILTHSRSHLPGLTYPVSPAGRDHWGLNNLAPNDCVDENGSQRLVPYVPKQLDSR